MKGAGILLSIPVLLAGCAALSGNQKTDYDNLPGSGDSMAKGPGLFAYGQHHDYQGGYRLFSDDPTQPALVHPPGQKEPRQTAEREDNAASGRPPVSTETSASHEPARKQRAQYRQFEEYQQFKRFQALPKDSPERRKFRAWQDWKQYEQWKQNSHP